MDRCALFVDAGYVLSDGAMAVHGTRRRESVSWDYAGLCQFLASLASESSALPLLRCYWYEATVEGQRSAEHDALADLPGVKLRLAKMRPGRREGVETEIHRDLTTLARNKAISNALVVSAEEDLAQVIGDVQDLGLRVTMAHITVDGNGTISRTLRQECDDITEITSAHLRPYVELISGAEPPRPDEQEPPAPVPLRPMANGHSANHAGPYQPVSAGPAAAHQVPPSIYTAPAAAEYVRPATQLVPDAGPAQEDRSPAEEVPARQDLPVRQDLPARQDLSARQDAAVARHDAMPMQDALAGQDALPRHDAAPARDALTGHDARASQDGMARQGTAVWQEAARHEQAARQDEIARQEAVARQESVARQDALARHEDAARQESARQDAARQDRPAPVDASMTMQDISSARPDGGMGRQDIYGAPVSALPDERVSQYPAPQAVPASQQPQPTPQPPPPAPTPMPGLAPVPGPPGPTPLPGQGPLPGPTPVPNAPAAHSASGNQHQGQPGGAGQSAGYPSARPGPYAVPQSLGNQQSSSPLQPVTGPQPATPTFSPNPPAAHAAPSAPTAAPPAPAAAPAAPAPPVPMSAATVSPAAVSLTDAVQAAHEEGQDFGSSVARDAPALWLEAVLARKPRMPSDLEARLLQGSALPIDFLLHDEVRHALRRGFWDALERSRR